MGELPSGLVSMELTSMSMIWNPSAQQDVTMAGTFDARKGKVGTPQRSCLLHGLPHLYPLEMVLGLHHP
jgi:hypothetical protein